jgi:hypothetical protein
METINKEEFWQDHVTAWLSSGLSQAAYCKQHEIKFHNFAYWRNRLSPANVPSAKLMKLGAMPTSSVSDQQTTTYTKHFSQQMPRRVNGTAT